MNEFDISDDFIEQGKDMCQHRPKTSPHTKSERKSRRDEVFRLHFEYGYSARAISDLMKINRNTINSDVAFWYSKIRVDYDEEVFDDWLNKQLLRLESQRVRLRKEIDSDVTLQERIMVEKMLLDLDSKISNLIIKMLTAQYTQTDISVKCLNDCMDLEGSKKRYMSSGKLYRLPEKQSKKIFELLKKEYGKAKTI